MIDLDDARLTEFLDLAFDFVCQRPLSELMDPAQVLPALDQALTVERVARWQSRVVIPARERLLERARKSTLTLGAWLPDDVTQTLAELLGAPAPIPRKAIDDAVASEQVRDAVRVMLQETLTNFISKVTAGSGGTGGAGGALKDAIGWSARFAGAAGRGLLGGLSGEVQRMLQDRVRDYVDGAVTLLQQRIAEKLASPETARGIGQQRRRAFLGLLRRTEAEAAATMAKAPNDKIDPLVPKIIAHNVARAELRAAIVDELRAGLAELSAQSVGELLDEAGLRAAARAALHAHGLPIARALVATPAFAAFYAKLP